MEIYRNTKNVNFTLVSIYPKEKWEISQSRLNQNIQKYNYWIFYYWLCRCFEGQVKEGDHEDDLWPVEEGQVEGAGQVKEEDEAMCLNE